MQIVSPINLNSHVFSIAISARSKYKESVKKNKFEWYKFNMPL